MGDLGRRARRAPTATYLNLDALDDGAVVARFDFHGRPAPRDFDPKPSLHVVMNEAEFPDLRGVDVVDLLGQFTWWVDSEIMHDFRELL